MKLCWICGNPATTAEHKFKRTDLQRVHGHGKAFSDANLNYLKLDDTVVELQGPNSDHVKYKDVLCSNCNNATSQPYDRAYDRFIKYVETEREELISCRQFDFNLVFGPDWREQQRNLYKYFVKAFGCRLAAAGVNVPISFRQVLSDEHPDTGPIFCFAVVEEELDKPISEQKTLRLNNIIHVPNSTGSPRYATSARFRWLLSSYWFGWGPYGPVGEAWFGEQQFLCLGSHSSAQTAVEIRRADGTLAPWPGVET